jgi:uncharacterized protein DUF4031
MTVYVDNARIPANVGGFNSRWSHLTADDEEELHLFAESIGLKRAWFQTCKANRRRCPPETCPHWHYDVTESKRTQAVRAGAVEMDIRKWSEIIRHRRAAT